MSSTMILVIVVVAVALFFDFFNGFHDAANAIATIVVSKTLTPIQALVLAGFANFVGYFSTIIFYGGVPKVAATIGKGVVQLQSVTLTLLLAALIGAILWNILTWLLGLPTSSSHALIGGIIGAAVGAAGFKVVILYGVLRIVLFILIAPVFGFIGASLFTILIIRLFSKSNPIKSQKTFKGLQLISAALYSVSHGTNDAQKTMGVIAMALVAGGIFQTFTVPHWVMISCYGAIGLGTMFGGWRIVKTMGTKITKIHAMEGFCAETASAAVIFASSHLGIPVSTTHVISGSIMGVGAVESAGTVRWVTARKILWAWLLTIPATAGCAWLVYEAINLISKFI